MADESFATWLATALGYLIGLGSLMLYTPIAVRLFRQKSADGTTMVTWMMKLSSYTCTDLYSLWKHYPISTYIDTLVITFQAAIVLTLVVIYQQRYRDHALWGFIIAFSSGSLYLYFLAPPKILALGQLSSAGLNTGALIPQFLLNYKNKTKGDYSPVTAALATVGCAVRLFTIQQLADSDSILFFSFGSALLLNIGLLSQIVYYGLMVEGLSLGQIFSADVRAPSVVEYVTISANVQEKTTLSQFSAMDPLEILQGTEDNERIVIVPTPFSASRRVSS